MTLLGVRKDDWTFIIPASVVFFSALAVTALDYLHHAAEYRIDASVLLGLAFGVGGATIRKMAKIALAGQFKYLLQTAPEQQLIRHGIYRWARHPGYLGLLLAEWAIPLVFRSLAGLLIMLLLIPLVLYRIHIEERMLLQQFGDDYRAYRNNTKKLIPYIY